MALSQTIERIITPTVEGMGYELVRLTVSGGQRKTLQVMAEPKDGRNMSLDDCSHLSRAISAVLKPQSVRSARATRVRLPIVVSAATSAGTRFWIESAAPAPGGSSETSQG